MPFFIVHVGINFAKIAKNNPQKIVHRVSGLCGSCLYTWYERSEHWRKKPKLPAYSLNTGYI